MNTSKTEKLSNPSPHFLVSSSKKIHGWFPWGRRQCTQERFLLNPYNGCSVGCFYCYARSFPGYFQQFHKKASIFVFKDFDKSVSRQLDALSVGFCGYLSPVTDPFQKIDSFYRLSEKVIEAFVERNLPIEFITKEKIPEEVINLIRSQKDSFGQVSICTSKPDLNKFLSRGASVEVLFENIKRLHKSSIYAVCRIDPILPYITDSKDDLRELMETAKKSGASHIIASVLDIPFRLKGHILERINKGFGSQMMNKYLRLYKEKIGYLHADTSYRKDLFFFLRKQADRLGLTFSLCMEYKLQDGVVSGLNQQFSSSYNCEGKDTPIYKRRGTKFYPQENCRGNCLVCRNPVCGIEELAYGKTNKPLALKYSDYRSFSRKLAS